MLAKIITILKCVDVKFLNFYERLNNANTTPDQFYNLRTEQSDNALELAIEAYNNKAREHIFNQVHMHPSPNAVFMAALKDRYSLIPKRIPVSHNLLDTFNKLFDQISVGNLSIESAGKIIDVYQNFALFRENEHLIREHSDTALKLYIDSLENFVLEKPIESPDFDGVEISGIDLPEPKGD